MRIRSIVATLALVSGLAVAGCSASGVPDAATPGVMGSGHTNPEAPGSPNGGTK